MNRRISFLAAVLAIALTAPAASAGWIAFGNQEPSTDYDTPSHMWPGSHEGAGDRVYFNAFETHQAASNVNPNAGTLESRVQPFPVLEFDAMFGLWKDCNGDGYVGLAESAVLEYRAELLLDDGVCPSDGAHNDGQWVYEYLMFAVEDPCVWATEAERAQEGHDCEGFAGQPTQMPGMIPLRTGKVWGDNQRPDFLTDERPDGTCAITPIPEGTTASTGMALRYFECNGGLLTRINAVLEPADPDDALGLHFTDRDNPQDTDHPLNVGLPVNLWGNPVAGQEKTGLLEEESGDAAYTYDCQGDQQTVEDPTGTRRVPITDPVGGLPTQVEDPSDPEGGSIPLANEDGEYGAIVLADEDGVIARVGFAVPSVRDPTASYYDSIDQTWNAVYLSAGYAVYAGPGFQNTGPEGDCEPDRRTGWDDGTNAFAKSTLDNPSSEGTQQAPGRQQTDWTFQWIGAVGLVYNAGIAPFKEAPLLSTVFDAAGQRAPLDGGASGMRFFTGATWAGTPNLLLPPMTGLRTDAPGENDGTPGAPTYYSFYAQVDRAEMATLFYELPGGSIDFVYGSEQCGNARDGVLNGFDCDPANWYQSANGVDTSTWINARVHDLYQLRDVDCFDNHVTAGVHAGNIRPCGVEPEPVEG